MASYVCIVVEVTVERTVPSVGYGSFSQVDVSVPLASYAGTPHQWWSQPFPVVYWAG